MVIRQNQFKQTKCNTKNGEKKYNTISDLFQYGYLENRNRIDKVETMNSKSHAVTR